ncbi:MAG TPA: hypothetical protein PK205_07020 [Promineifilum sp.]|nr:hypothetical protein [Promineifilum sp.]
MKFTVTISDASPAELANLFSYLNNSGNGEALAALTIAGNGGSGGMPNNGTAVAARATITPPAADADKAAQYAAMPMPAAPVAPPMPTTVPAAISGQPVVASEPMEPVNTAAPAFDSSGLPWDARIHAATKATTADGKWRRRRGVADEFVTAVEAELRANAGAGVPGNPASALTLTPPAHIVPPAPVAMPQMPVAPPVPPAVPAMPMAPPAMPMPAAPDVPPMPAPAPVATGNVGMIDFTTFMQRISYAMQTAGQNGLQPINAEYLMNLTVEISRQFGVHLNAITDIADKPEYINFAVHCMQRDQRWPNL